MILSRDSDNYLIRLDKGELLVESLLKVIRDNQIKSGWISGLGGALKAELGFYDLTSKQYLWKKLDFSLEITNIVGNISLNDDQPYLHLHGTFSDKEMKAFGGHIKELTVAGTCEIMIHLWNGPQLNRQLDNQVGLKTLNL